MALFLDSNKNDSVILTPIVSLRAQQDGRKKRTAQKKLVRDKRIRAITCMFCRDLHLTPMFSGPLQKDLFKGK